MTPRELLLQLTSATRVTMRAARNHLQKGTSTQAEAALTVIRWVITYNTDVETHLTEDDTKCLVLLVAEIRKALLPIRDHLWAVTDDPHTAIAVMPIQQLLDFTTECANELGSSLMASGI